MLWMMLIFRLGLNPRISYNGYRELKFRRRTVLPLHPFSDTIIGIYFTSKKTLFFNLGLTALVCSRVMFSFSNDPEGPNLLIVAVTAMIIYAVSGVVYKFYPSNKEDNLMKLFVLILVQILVTTGFYFLLN